MNGEYVGTGHLEKIDNLRDRIPDFDPRSGNHLWTVLTLYNVDPETYLAGKSVLDHENLMNITPPGCYYCEKAYTPLLATRKCTGEE